MILGHAPAMRIRYAALIAAGLLIIAMAFLFCSPDGSSILSYRPAWILIGFCALCGGCAGAYIDRPMRTMLERASEILDAFREIGAREWPGAIICDNAGQCVFVSGKRLGESLEDSDEPEIFAVWNERERGEILDMLRKSLFTPSEKPEESFLLERFLPPGVVAIRLVEHREGQVFIFDYGEKSVEE